MGLYPSMNLSAAPNKLPSFMKKQADEMVTATLESLEEELENEPAEKIIDKYRLTKFEDSASEVYTRTIEEDILKIYKYDNPLIESLCNDSKLFFQAIKSMPSSTLGSYIYYIRYDLNKPIDSFETFEIYDIACAMSQLALMSVMRDREDEIEDTCDLINDYIDQAKEVKNNPRYESIRRNRRRNTYR